MVTPIWKLQRELAYAQARESYYSDTTRPIKTTVDATPRIPVVYTSLFLKQGAAHLAFKLFASEKAVTEFGGATALGLSVASADLAVAENPSRGFESSKINLMFGDGTPTAVRAFNGTGRRYVKYSRTTAGTSQAHFTAPISSGTATPDVTAVETKIGTVTDAKKAAIGAYGRIWFEIEKYTKSTA